MVFAGAAALSVLTTLAGLDGRVPEAAGVIALLAAALHVVLLVHRPVARWALTAGIIAMAAACVMGRPAGREYGTAVLLVIAAAALLVGAAALPQFRRPASLTAAACLVALVPVVVVAVRVAEARDTLPQYISPLVLLRHLAPGLLATGLAGLVVVLAVSRADRWFLVPAGALLVQVTAVYTTWHMSGWWYIADSQHGVETSSAFLEPGLRTDVSVAVTPVDFEVGAALALAVLLLGPALIAAGAARTADAPAVV